MGRHKSKPAAAPAVLGSRIRQLRKARGLTLAQLGVETGLSHAFLSQVERGLARPSVTTLADIAQALGVSSAALLSQTSPGFAQLTRRDTAKTVFARTASAPVDVWALTGENALIKVLESAGQFEQSERMSHAGEEAVYVIEGQLEVSVGEELFLMEQGDLLNFDCTLVHTYRVVGTAPARILFIAVDPGQYATPVDERTYESRQAPAAGSA